MNAFIQHFLQNPRVIAESFEVVLKSFVVLASAGVFCLCSWPFRRVAASMRHLIWFFGLTSLLWLPLSSFLPHRMVWTVGGRPISGNEISLSLQLTPNQQS